MPGSVARGRAFAYNGRLVFAAFFIDGQDSMLDPKLLRSDLEGVAQRLAKRGFALDTERLAALESRRRELQAETERLQNERNTRSKSIGKAKANGEDIQPLLDEVSDLGERLDAA